MKIIGLISWFDEMPAWLGAAVASMAPFIDHVVAVDGAYILYPTGKAKSPGGQAEAIRESARACGLGVTVHEPQMRWGGNEVEKRAFLFAAAELVSHDANDWYFILDGDELVTDISMNVRQTLIDTELDVGQVTCWKERNHRGGEGAQFDSPKEEGEQIRKFFRAIPGLTVAKNHYTYVLPDGRKLWGDGTYPDIEEAIDLSRVKVEHRHAERDLTRQKTAAEFYTRREETGIETYGVGVE